MPTGGADTEKYEKARAVVANPEKYAPGTVQGAQRYIQEYDAKRGAPAEMSAEERARAKAAGYEEPPEVPETPPEPSGENFFIPPGMGGADLLRLAPMGGGVWHEPTPEQFLREARPGIQQTMDVDSVPESKEYQSWVEQKWSEALSQAKAEGRPLIRMKALRAAGEKAGDYDPTKAAANIHDTAVQAAGALMHAGEGVVPGFSRFVGDTLGEGDTTRQMMEKTHPALKYPALLAGGVLPGSLPSMLGGGLYRLAQKGLGAGVSTPGGKEVLKRLVAAGLAGAGSGAVEGTVEETLAGSPEKIPDTAKTYAMLGAGLGVPAQAVGELGLRVVRGLREGDKGQQLRNVEEAGGTTATFGRGGVETPDWAQAARAEASRRSAAESLPTDATEVLLDEPAEAMKRKALELSELPDQLTSKKVRRYHKSKVGRTPQSLAPVIQAVGRLLSGPSRAGAVDVVELSGGHPEMKKWFRSFLKVEGVVPEHEAARLKDAGVETIRVPVEQARAMGFDVQLPHEKPRPTMLGRADELEFDEAGHALLPEGERKSSMVAILSPRTATSAELEELVQLTGDLAQYESASKNKARARLFQEVDRALRSVRDRFRSTDQTRNLRRVVEGAGPQGETKTVGGYSALKAAEEEQIQGMRSALKETGLPVPAEGGTSKMDVTKPHPDQPRTPAMTGEQERKFREGLRALAYSKGSKERSRQLLKLAHLAGVYDEIKQAVASVDLARLQGLTGEDAPRTGVVAGLHGPRVFQSTTAEKALQRLDPIARRLAVEGSDKLKSFVREIQGLDLPETAMPPMAQTGRPATAGLRGGQAGARAIKPTEDVFRDILAAVAQEEEKKPLTKEPSILGELIITGGAP